MAQIEPLGVPALGRNAEIGMLYDVRSHKLIQKAFLWEPEDVAAKLTSKQEDPTVHYEASDLPTFESIAAELFITENMQLDILSGTLHIRGAASVLLHPRLRSTGLLHVHQTTRMDKIPSKLLDKISIRNTKLVYDDVGTHVVMGITYGAAAFLLVDSEDKEYSDNDLETLAHQIRTGNVPTGEHATGRKLSIHGDFLGQSGELSLSDVQSYFSSPEDQNVYPKFLWLCPLDHFDKRAKAIQQEIQENLRNELLQVLTGLSELESRITSLQADLVYKTFTWIGSSLVVAADITKAYTEKFKEKIGKRLSEFRSGEAQPSELRAMLAKHYESPFHEKVIQAWLYIKQAEKECLKKFEEILSTAVYEDCLSSTHLNRKLRDPKISRLVVLTFLVPGMSDPFAEDVTDNGDTRGPDEMAYWFNDSGSLRKMEKDIRDFVSFAQANVDQPGVCSAIGKTKERWIRDLGVTQIIMYADGALVPFVPAKKAPSLLLSETTHDSVTVSWSAQTTDFILHYLCEYRECDGKMSDWIVTQIPNDMRTAHVRSHTFEGLTTDCSYEFRVSAVYKNGFEIQTEILGPLRIPSAPSLINKDSP